MDYGELLYKAHENNKNASNKEVRCYKTSFSPPRKLERNVSSANVQKFLARREEEERKKALEAKRRKEELLALRSQDKKATRRVQTMLRATKSANKSVMEDAIDNVNTRDTLNGFQQCDEDDYGYVSQEASALYNKLLHKYETMPPEPPKFKPAVKKELKDLNAAKDRVRAALQKEADDELLPHKRKKKKKHDDDDPSEKNDDEHTAEEVNVEEKKVVKVKPKKPAPPPMDFNQLLQIAKKKQFEPIVIDESLLKKEPERLMTKKQKLEAEKMASYKKNKTGESSSKSDVQRKQSCSKPEQSKANNRSETEKLYSVKSDTNKSEKKNVSFSVPTAKVKTLDSKSAMESLKKDSSVWTKTAASSSQEVKKKSSSQTGKTSLSLSKSVPKIEKKSTPESSKTDSFNSNKNTNSGTSKVSSLEKEILEMKAKQEILLRQLKEKELAMKKLEETKKLENLKKQVEELKRKEQMINEQTKRELVKKSRKPIMEKKKPVPPKRRIDSESEEYDSEMDDFIDDGPDEGNEYSKYISEIFGYDKSKYADDDGAECEESDYKQVSKEEFVSTRCGIMEDLADIKKEQEEKRRLKAKKMKKMAEERKKKNKY